MRSLIACGALAVAASLTACSEPEPCSSSRPGVEVTLVFEPISAGMPPSWTGEGRLTLYQSNNAEGLTEVDVAPAALDAEGRAIVVAAFPAHAKSGFFYADFLASDPSQGGSWTGWANFQADPATCHRVELDVRFTGGGADDGGVPAPDAAP